MSRMLQWNRQQRGTPIDLGQLFVSGCNTWNGKWASWLEIRFCADKLAERNTADTARASQKCFLGFEVSSTANYSPAGKSKLTGSNDVSHWQPRHRSPVCHHLQTSSFSDRPHVAAV